MPQQDHSRPQQVRLARQRTRPDRIRRRSGGRAQPSRSRTAATEWLTSWGTFLSAIAAAGGLIVSGFASWAAVAELRDQREEKAAERQSDLANEASHILAWTDYNPRLPFQTPEADARPRGNIFILNRSQSPIVEWGVVFKQLQQVGSSVTIENGRFFGVIQSIPPCTKLTIPVREVEGLSSIGYNAVTGIEFRDSRGGKWARSLSGRLNSLKGWSSSYEASTLEHVKEDRAPGCDVQ